MWLIQLLCVLGSYCLAVTQASHCGKFRRDQLLNWHAQSKLYWKSDMLPIFYHYFDISFEFKASSEYFLANQIGEFKTELNLKYRLEISWVHPYHIYSNNTTPDYPVRSTPNMRRPQISAAFEAWRINKHSVAYSRKYDKLPWVSLVTAPCSRTCE